MTVQAYIVMTPAQRDAAELLNDEDVAIGAQEITNPMANNLGLGVLVGKWVAPARLLNDPDYSRWASSLGSLPISVLDSETLFLPPPEL